MVNIAVVVAKCNLNQLVFPFHFMLPIFSSKIPVNKSRKVFIYATYIKIIISSRTGRMIDLGEIVNFFHRCNFHDFRML